MSARSNSRHVTGVLPSKHFFIPRKPIKPNSNASAMRKATSSSALNSPSSSHHTSSQMRLPVVGSTLSSESTSEGAVRLARLTLPRISTSLDLSLDYIIASNREGGGDTSFSLPELPPSALLARRQTRTDSVIDIPQAVIDSVLEPIDISTNTLKRPSSGSTNLSGTPSNVPSRFSPNKKLSPTTPPLQSPNSFLSIPYSSTTRPQIMWPGRNRFFLGGRIITSRDFPAFLVALFALIVPCALFLSFTAPFLYSHVSPAVVVVFVYLFLLALSSMLITSWTDPGIIPRNLDPSPPTEEFDEGDHHLSQSQYSPPRCSHCRQCDNCVENEDHHCIWLNNCIGRRNYRSFFTFITTATILCIYVAGFVWSVGGLSSYHIYLISHNLTTHEQLRASLARRNGLRNQYDFGSVYKNCVWVLCRPLVHSSINRRAFIESDSVGDREIQDDGTSTVPQMTSMSNLSLAGPSSRTNQDRVSASVA
ncbi:14600_t:CDS:2 [Ambispora leptoticha]|uniref:Palmitoyltransferase n=1 Tax=Ambispora leptoticha TaxID=144679 RepID=A0A9N8YT19_9GLOM|nr:14600_t:CDS:2 [Ambispora leptoticha]